MLLRLITYQGTQASCEGAPEQQRRHDARPRGPTCRALYDE